MYLAPDYEQVKRVAWKALKDALAGTGSAYNEAELLATLPNGSRVQLLGASRYNSLRGMHLHGIVIDEYADVAPEAWRMVIRPALASHSGFAIFIGTPKGRNHFFDLYQRATTDPDWFTALYRWQDSGVVGPKTGQDAVAEVELARKQMTPEEFQQEYECSFEAAIVGAYYAKQFAEARANGKIRELMWEPTIPVETWWDLGRADATAIIFTQTIGREVRCVDYLEARGEDLKFYAKALQAKPYLYGTHHLPHDAGHKTLAGGGASIEAQLRALGLPLTKVYQKQEPLVGINQARLFFPRVYFDAVKCERLLTCLAAYRAKPAQHGVEATEPYHDEFSHGADAFRLLASHHADEQGRKSMQSIQPRPMRRPPRDSMAWDPFDYERQGSGRW